MYFFSDRRAYDVCGMFTTGHFVFLFVLYTFIILGLYLSRNCTKEEIRKQTKVLAIIITVLEFVKIGYNHYYNCFGDVNCWVPLSFCALLLYASWFSISKNEFIRRMGSIFISAGATIAGSAYLIYPSTSLTEVQAFHFLAFHGMGYHAIMVYLGLLFLLHEVCEPNRENFKYFVSFLGGIFTVVIALDYIFQINFMFFYDAYNLPKFVQTICEWNRPFYTLLVALFYIFGTYGAAIGLRTLRDVARGKFVKIEGNEVEESKLNS